ncbi:MAG TPA: NAD-dependent epimerase/dehydratase family protein [Gammaproteobacteria bacterium]|nr:NAD-dependent epimerase/dehydratase family protein [Gammaproteobacteria bacterium]
MKALVTGATGFIGARLAEQLAKGGHEVVAFGAENTELETRRRRALEAAGVGVELGSVADAPLLRRLVAGVDTVYHLAAAQHESNVGEDYFRAINVEGTRNLLEACAAADVSRYVHGSTIGVYGSARNGTLDESSPPHPENMYGVTKLEAEEVVKSFAGRLPFTIVRISETYGPGDGRLLKLFKLVNDGFVPLIGGGRNEHQPVYVDDLVAGLELAAARDEAVGETIVLAGSEVLPTRTFVERVAEALGKPLRAVSLPLAPFLVAAFVCEKTCRPLGISPPWHRRRLDFFVKRFAFSQEKAKRLLGYAPAVPFNQGAALTADWYRAEGML